MLIKENESIENFLESDTETKRKILDTIWKDEGKRRQFFNGLYEVIYYDMTQKRTFHAENYILTTDGEKVLTASSRLKDIFDILNHEELRYLFDFKSGSYTHYDSYDREEFGARERALDNYRWAWGTFLTRAVLFIFLDSEITISFASMPEGIDLRYIRIIAESEDDKKRLKKIFEALGTVQLADFLEIFFIREDIDFFFDLIPEEKAKRVGFILGKLGERLKTEPYRFSEFFH